MNMKINLALLSILALFLCSCGASRTTDGVIHFSQPNKMAVVYVEINGKKETLLIDTGASQSLIDVTLKDRLNYSLVNAGVTYNGLGGHQASYHTKGIEVKYKDRVLNINFKAVDLKNVRNSLGISGVIGSDYLTKNKLIINYGNSTISSYHRASSK